MKVWSNWRMAVSSQGPVCNLLAGKGHDLVVECYGTNDVMGNDFQAYALVIEILSPPRSTQDIWSVPKHSGTKLDMFHLSRKPSSKPLLVQRTGDDGLPLPGGGGHGHGSHHLCPK
eukprot:TRINITY_DN13596_c0_g1_i2.p1 TRINITY_DN13596_c0_g1~~TRINITY_DN13596_c0_g1_i2.p1  ORF type:complete len:116 (-),score=22.42 TRINITY_DN13596_c0_g1_i2:229-576(-)